MSAAIFELKLYGYYYAYETSICQTVGNKFTDYLAMININVTLGGGHQGANVR